jgi:transcriptional regulator with XRE-family HTH domain
MEKASAIKKLMKLRGWNQLQAACNLGVSHSYIQQLLALLKAPKGN